MAKKGEERPAVVVEELPRTIVRRIVKDKLSRLSSTPSSSSLSGRGSGSTAAGGDEGDADGMNVHRDALLAFSESARIFIHYLSATANDICRESRRQIINADDVFKALEEIEFPEFIEPLRVSLEDFRRTNAAKKSGSKDKKRKVEEEEELHSGNGIADGGENLADVDEEDDEADGNEVDAQDDE